MKILKFNKSYDYNIDINEEYINECFVELYDKYDIFIFFDHDDLYFSVDVKVNIENYGDYGYNEDDMTYISNTLSTLMEISSESMEKVKIKYNDVKPFYDFFKLNEDQSSYTFRIYTK